MQTTVRILKAMALASRIHSGQTRKGPAGEPYVNHVIEVGCLLAEATDGEDEVLVVGGLLHDVLEDGPRTPQEYAVLAGEIERDFGPEVLALVEEVTDAPSSSEAERWRNQVEGAPHKSVRGKLLKIADKTSNLREILRGAPPHWEHEHLIGYIDWGRDVVAGCRGLNAPLEAVFDRVYADARAKYLKKQGKTVAARDNFAQAQTRIDAPCRTFYKECGSQPPNGLRLFCEGEFT